MSTCRFASYGLLSVLLLLPGALLARGWELGHEISHRSADLSMAANRVWRVEPVADTFAREVERLELPIGVRDVMVVERERQFNRAPDDFTWVGKGDHGELAVLTIKGQALAGKVYAGDRTLEIRPDAQYGTVMIELDPSRFPSCSGGIDPGDHDYEIHRHDHSRLMQDSGIQVDGARTNDDAIRIDTLFAFTPTVADRLGSEDQRWAVALLAVDMTNLAFANSDVDVFMRVNHVDVVASQESDSCVGSDGDLGAAASNSDLQNLRDAHDADLVAMITDGGYCGCAYVQRNPGSGFAPSAYQATSMGCAIGGLVVAHEFGHNLGMEHDPANSNAYPDGASYDWSFGHFVEGHFRTVMSYSTECDSCPRQPHFSNPDIDFEGVPTGIADQRDNARTARAIAPIASEFRIAPDEAMPMPLLSPSPVSLALQPDQSDVYTIELANQGDDPFEWVIDETVVESSAADRSSHDPALDEHFDHPEFIVTGGDDEGETSWEVFPYAGGYATTGEVVGVSFQGDVALQEQDDLASNLRMVLLGPDENFHFFGSRTSRPWEFGSADEDGFYATSFHDVFNADPLPDKGRWLVWFTNDTDEEEEQIWSNVRVTLHKTPLPAGCQAPSTVAWLTGVSPQGGVLDSGSNQSIELSVDSTGLAPGSYQAALCLKINDPRIETMVADVELMVSDDAPEIFQDRFEDEP